MATGIHVGDDDGFPAIEVVLREPIKFRCYAVDMAGDRGLRFMTHLALKHHIGFPPNRELPEYGQTLVYNDLHPFGRRVSWARIPGGATSEEMVDWNLRGEMELQE